MNRRKIEDKLIQSGIYPSLKGFICITEAVEVYRPAMSATLLYAHIANICGSTPGRVERNIRHARQKSEAYKDKTNTEFLSLLRWELEGRSQSE